MLEKIFKLSHFQTTISRELLAGLTTFLTMAYILFVQPSLLVKDFTGQPTGLDFGAVLFATCLASGLTTMAMGLFANYPIALAPGMGENFFFVSVIMVLASLGVPEAGQVALGIVFIAGLLFFLLSILPVREMIMNAMSASLRNGIAVGIGLFITLIGFQHAQLIVAKPGTMLGLNAHFATPAMAVFGLGLVVSSFLYVRQVKGAILWGIFASTILALGLGEIHYTGFWGIPQIKKSLILTMDVRSALSLTCLPFIFVFLFMDVFDTIGTLTGVAEAAGFVKDNRIPRAKSVLAVDSLGTVFGACVGTSTVTSYIESAAGVACGGRTGLASLATGILFLLALFFSPIIAMVGQYAPITASALVIVGFMMMTNIRKIDWDDLSESIPSFLVIVGIPFCYSIADGLALGFMSYPIVKFLSGRGRSVHSLMYIMAVILLLYFLFIRTRVG